VSWDRLRRDSRWWCEWSCGTHRLVDRLAARTAVGVDGERGASVPGLMQHLSIGGCTEPQGGTSTGAREEEQGLSKQRREGSCLHGLRDNLECHKQ
jgi:hypothetical protein